MVAPAIIAAGIGAAGSLAGTGLSMLGRGGGGSPDMSSFYQNWRNDDMAWSREQFDRSEALQREFAQNGIRWRVEDAKAAGLHPLAAIGASGASAAPISVGGGGNYNVDFGRPSRDDTGAHLGAGLASMGQNISRAYLASQTPEAKVATAFELARQAQQLEHGGLQNEYLKMQMARWAQQGDSPGVPGPGPTGQYVNKPYEVHGSNPAAPYTAAGPTQPETEHRATPNGSVVGYPAAGMNIDEMGSPGYLGWMMRNRLMGFLDGKTGRPPDSQLPQGAIGWRHHFGEWYPKYPSKDFSHLPSHPADYPRGAGSQQWMNYRR